MSETKDLSVNEVCDLRLFKNNLESSQISNKQSKRFLSGVSWLDTPLFFRYGIHNYGKINYGSSKERYKTDYLGFRPKTKVWYKLDFLLDWEGLEVGFYLNGKYQDRFNFYHGVDKMAVSNA